MRPDTSLADEILRDLRPAAQLPTLPDKPAAPDMIASPPTAPKLNILEIPLDQICIDPQQRRRYLPADLRAAVIHNTQSAQDGLIELLARAGRGDAEAQGYVESMRLLASSIDRVGLQQAIRVAPEVTNQGDLRYRIVQGERRFWAHVLLKRATISAVLETDEHSADVIEQAQWAENLEREEVPAADFADAVWDIRHRHLSRLAVDKHYLAKSLGADMDKLSPDEAIARLTMQEIERITGRALATSTLYRYLYIAEHLSVDAKNVARAHSINVSRLHQIAHLPIPDQLNAVRRAAGLPVLASDNPSQIINNGRPTTLHRCTALCINLLNALNQLANKHIERGNPEDRQALLEELDAATTAIEQTRQRLRQRAK